MADNLCDLALIIKSRFPLVLVVAAIYEALAEKTPLVTAQVLTKIGRTRPLSVMMAEKVERAVRMGDGADGEGGLGNPSNRYLTRTLYFSIRNSTPAG